MPDPLLENRVLSACRSMLMARMDVGRDVPDLGRAQLLEPRHPFLSSLRNDADVVFNGRPCLNFGPLSDGPMPPSSALPWQAAHSAR